MGHLKTGGPRGKAGEGRGQGQKEQEGHELQASSSLQGPLLPPQPTSLALVVSKFQSEGGAPVKAGAGAGRSRHRTETKRGTKRDPSSQGPSISVQGARVLSPAPGEICLFTSPLLGLGNLESRGAMFEQGGAPQDSMGCSGPSMPSRQPRRNEGTELAWPSWPLLQTVPFVSLSWKTSTETILTQANPMQPPSSMESHTRVPPAQPAPLSLYPTHPNQSLFTHVA